MGSILDDPVNRVKLLKAGYTGKDIEYLAIYIFNTNIELVKINWLNEV